MSAKKKKNALSTQKTQVAEAVTNILIGESLLSNSSVCLSLDSYHLCQANSSRSDSLQGRYCLLLSATQSTFLR